MCNDPPAATPTTPTPTTGSTPPTPAPASAALAAGSPRTPVTASPRTPDNRSNPAAASESTQVPAAASTAAQGPGLTIAPVRGHRVWPIVALLLIAHAALAFSASTRKSVTYDEVAHLTAGYSYWTTRDFRLVPEHPPLAELWAALPLMAADLAFPPLDQPAWWGSDQWTLGRAFLFTLGNDLSFMLGASRFMIVVLSAALGLAVFFWSKRVFGTAGGFVSLVLYALSPTTLAHAALVTTDMAVALFFTLAVCASWSVLQRVTALRVAAGGLAVAGLLLAKMSGLLILPMLVVMVVVRVASRAPLPVVLGKRWRVGPRPARVRVLVGVGLVETFLVWGLIWAAYGFRFDAMVDAEPGRDRFGVYMQRVPDGTSWDQELAGAGAAAPLIASALDLRLLPEAYLYGIAHTINSTRVRQAFLNGRRTMHGFTAFFPYCLLVKTPLPLFGVIILALIAYAARRRRGTRGADDPPVTTIMAYDTIPAWTLLVVYLCVSMASPMNIGHRHILPIYPVLFLVAGAAASLLRHPRRLARWSVPAMLAAHAAVSLTTWPNYIAFFNTTVGGPRTAYRHLVDSSLDWGQDLPALARHLRDHTPQHRAAATSPPDAKDAVPPADTPPRDTVYLTYFGTAMPAHYGIDATTLLGYPTPAASQRFPLTPGVYCISATMLQQVYLLPISRWTHALERTYQACLPDIRSLQTDTVPSLPSNNREQTRRYIDMLTKLRFARLSAALRQREPDDRAGYSILIYDVTQRALDSALFGPPPELSPDDPETLIDLAADLGRTGRTELAAAAFRDALRLDPRLREMLKANGVDTSRR